MNVVLVHPVHGAKVATLEAEMEHDLKEGWVVYTPPSPQVVREVPPVAKSKKVKGEGLPDFLVSGEGA